MTFEIQKSVFETGVFVFCPVSCMRKEYQKKANGKFLITGEYVVLRGIEALAIPLKLGQKILMVPYEGEAIYWESFSPEGKWFECALANNNLAIISASDEGKARKLAEILSEIRKENAQFLADGGWWVRTDLEFHTQYGMGSSSTLLALLCDAASVNPYRVLKNTFGGSGYDIACAFADGPILYSLQHGNLNPEIKSAKIAEAVKNHLLFVYSGNKMVSSGEVKKFASVSVSQAVLNRLSEISREASDIEDYKVFGLLMTEHEHLMSEILARPCIADSFRDFDGTVKSMGAWGGDFFMAICEEVNQAKNYFHEKGFPVVFEYRDIAL